MQVRQCPCALSPFQSSVLTIVLIPYVSILVECLDRFYQSHADRPGIAVLAFLVEDAEIIKERYEKLHPNLLVDMWDYPEDQVKILEVYAYYDEGDEDADKTKRNADKGTILRFVQDNRQGAGEHVGAFCPVPGLKQVDAKYDDFTQPAYCDHWVSNGKNKDAMAANFARAPLLIDHLHFCWLEYKSVFHRREFLDTLEDTLDFTPKVRLIILQF